MLYSDIFIDTDDHFRVYDKKLITIFLADNRSFSGTIEIFYRVKSIKQYFQKEHISIGSYIITN